MALISVMQKTKLASPLILAPERYDPRRQIDTNDREIIELCELIVLEKKTVSASASLEKCLILDTSDAREGIIICRKKPVSGNEIGSNKKVVMPNDVIISKLRPYLRQVAYVDAEIPNSQNINILCSTEYFVLRSPNSESIAFLVPFLLSKSVQEILSASQEGGHHPRFNETALLTLPLPKELLAERRTVSESVIKSVQSYRQSEKGIDSIIGKVDAYMENGCIAKIR